MKDTFGGKMTGKILHFSIQEGKGIISASDGQRYDFLSEAWKSFEIHPVKDTEVDFTISEGNAVAIYALNNAQTHHQTHITLQAPQTSMAAVVSMIFGIIGIFFTWWVLAIPSVIAIIAGHVARSNIASSHGKLGGDGFAIAGLILGYIVIALYILVAFIFVGALSALSSIR